MNLRHPKEDYLNGSPELRSFYRYAFPLSDYRELLEHRAGFPIDRKLLVRELLVQNRAFPSARASLDNIQLLEKENTFTVTTGHQLVLMGGPMYMLYKIASAIRLAEIIQEKHPDYHIVPVFWMASEDHDWEEINHFHPNFFEPLSYPGAFRGPVGRHHLEASIQEALAQVPEIFQEIYQPGIDLSEAFRRLVLELFGDRGLVVIDADSPALKRALIPYMEAEVQGRGMGPHVAATTERLKAAGYQAQILPREVNLFDMGDGGRQLLLPTEGGFHTRGSNEVIPETELLRRIRNRPEDFSPNVSMRPLYQEVLLPNLAYIGGWAEMSYWMQLQGGFEASGVPFPLLVPRMTAALLPQQAAAEWSALAFQPADLELPLHQLYDQYLDRHWDRKELEEKLATLVEAHESLAGLVEAVDAPMAGMVRAQTAQHHKFQDKLLKKLKKSLRNRNPEPYRQINALKDHWHPDGKKQERVLNFTAFTETPAPDLVEVILTHCQPEQYAEQWILLP